MLPRITLVLGKGGVGRSTVSTALSLDCAARGKRVLLFEWTVQDPIGPWFGRDPAGALPREVAPGISVLNYSLEEALRAYFVDHLGLRLFYRRVLRSGPVARMVDAAPGIGELLFLGQMWWLTTLAPKEAGIDVDHIVVDTPATGHGVTILDFPAMLSSIRATGLLALEIERVTTMMADAAWTGTVVVTTPEELAVEETLELVPGVRRRSNRPPLCVLINRSVRGLIGERDAPPWLDVLRGRLNPTTSTALSALQADLQARARRESDLREVLAGATELGFLSLPEQLAVAGDSTPLEVARALSGPVGHFLRGGS